MYPYAGDMTLRQEVSTGGRGRRGDHARRPGGHRQLRHHRRGRVEVRRAEDRVRQQREPRHRRQGAEAERGVALDGDDERASGGDERRRPRVRHRPPARERRGRPRVRRQAAVGRAAPDDGPGDRRQVARGVHARGQAQAADGTVRHLPGRRPARDPQREGDRRVRTGHAGGAGAGGEAARPAVPAGPGHPEARARRPACAGRTATRGGAADRAVAAAAADLPPGAACTGAC